MPQSTPFSGLSTIIHLIIIILASIILWFRKTILQKLFGVSSAQGELPEVALASASRELSKRIASIFIITVMFLAIMTSFTLALLTGLRTGIDEPQNEFLRSELKRIGNIRIELSRLGKVVYERNENLPDQNESFYQLQALIK